MATQVDEPFIKAPSDPPLAQPTAPEPTETPAPDAKVEEQRPAETTDTPQAEPTQPEEPEFYELPGGKQLDRVLGFEPGVGLDPDEAFADFPGYKTWKEAQVQKALDEADGTARRIEGAYGNALDLFNKAYKMASEGDAPAEAIEKALQPAKSAAAIAVFASLLDARGNPTDPAASRIIGPFMRGEKEWADTVKDYMAHVETEGYKKGKAEAEKNFEKVYNRKLELYARATKTAGRQAPREPGSSNGTVSSDESASLRAKINSGEGLNDAERARADALGLFDLQKLVRSR